MTLHITSPPALNCPLCAATPSSFYHRDRTRTYWQCPCCDLVFVPPAARLDARAEKAIYDLHENEPSDPGYRRFLTRLTKPLLPRLTKADHGLDFGCGPGPALAQMLSEAGMTMDLYDAFYKPNRAVWQHRYEFITATEVVEHLYNPAYEWARLFATLKPGGWLGIMTKRVRDQAAFVGWHYITDPTHVCFYSEATFAWIAGQWGAKLLLPGADVALLQKQE
ncbi:MAG: class I SAM-dependent methyltransferase [Caldilineaceae bacterium]